MLYDLSRRTEQERFKRRCNDLYKAGKVVELVEKKGKRTLRQNAYLHLLLGWYAMETGNTVEYVKRYYFKQLCNAELFAENRKDRHIGEITVLKSSKELDTAQMALAIDRFRNWSSAECGIYLPSPDEQGFLREIEIEMHKNKQWL